MKHLNAGAALACWIVIALLIGSGAYMMANHIQHPVKSPRELCADRGGVYVDLRSGARCFSKDAFK